MHIIQQYTVVKIGGNIIICGEKYRVNNIYILKKPNKYSLLAIMTRLDPLYICIYFLLTGFGNCRVVVATSALGMGVNPKDLTYVINYGVTQDVADYVQQIGRVGRSGDTRCHAIMYYYPRQLRKVSDVLKNMIQVSETKCLRSFIYSKFSPDGSIVNPIQPGHTCCSVCHDSCDCSDGVCYVSKFVFEQFHIDEANHSRNAPVRNVTDKHKEEFCVRLHEYRQTFSVANIFVPIDAVSGITNKIIENVVDSMNCITDAEFLLQNLNIVQRKVANIIFDILQNVMKDQSLSSSEEQSQVQSLQFQNLDLDEFNEEEYSSDSDF